MNLFYAFILGLVQGLTEFLPISSSGHLVLFSKIPWWPSQPLVFDTTLHLATAFTLIVYFHKDISRMVHCLYKDTANKNLSFSKLQEDSKLAVLLLLASIPAGLLGFLFEDKFETRFRTIESVMVFLILGSVLMFLSQRLGKKQKKIHELSTTPAIAIGLFQALALMPGFSRSGATISGGLIYGLQQVDAAKFSFLMSIPIVLLAGTYKLLTTDWNSVNIGIVPILIGFTTSFLTGLLVVHFLLNYLKKYNLNVFIFYRIFLVVFLLLLK